MGKYIFILLFVVQSCKSQNIVESTYTDNLTLTDFYFIVKLTSQEERTLTSEINIIYIHKNRTKVHTIINSSISDRNIDTTYMLSGLQSMDLDSFFFQIKEKQNLDTPPIYAGSGTEIKILLGDSSYTHSSKSYISLYNRLTSISK